MPPASASGDLEATPDFYAAYGQTLALWAWLESFLAAGFGIITELERPMAEAIFYSARSFLGRADMFEAALAKADINDEGRAFLKAAISCAIRYNGFRNSLAHGLFALDDADNVILVKPAELGSHTRYIGYADICRAAENIKTLKDALRDVYRAFLSDDRGLMTIAEGLRRVQELPRLANQVASAPKPKGRKHPPQS